MRRLSVLTAWDGAHPEYLARAAAALATQELDGGWALEWLLVLDRTPSAPEGLAVVPQVLRTHPRAPGVAAARTVGAAAATGELLYVLDADDELPRGALRALVAALLAEGDRCAWAASRSWDVIGPAGELVEHRTSALPAGTVKPGEVGAFRRLHGRCPVPPAQVLVRAEALWAAGGWPPLAIEEDTALLLALDADRCGTLVEGTHLRSRRHRGQGTADLTGLTPSFGTAEQWLRSRGLA